MIKTYGKRGVCRSTCMEFPVASMRLQLRNRKAIPNHWHACHQISIKPIMPRHSMTLSRHQDKLLQTPATLETLGSTSAVPFPVLMDLLSTTVWRHLCWATITFLHDLQAVITQPWGGYCIVSLLRQYGTLETRWHLRWKLQNQQWWLYCGKGYCWSLNSTFCFATLSESRRDSETVFTWMITSFEREGVGWPAAVAN